LKNQSLSADSGCEVDSLRNRMGELCRLRPSQKPPLLQPSGARLSPNQSRQCRHSLTFHGIPLGLLQVHPYLPRLPHRLKTPLSALRLRQSLQPIPQPWRVKAMPQA
jgi:hypothetical protein